MGTKLKKKTIFLFSLIFAGSLGLVHTIIVDNFSKSRSTFRKESITELPNFLETAEADIGPVSGGGSGGGSGGDSDGACGDGSNGIQ